MICAGCNGPALGKLALRFYVQGHDKPAGWIITATPSCGPCAKATAPGDVASAEEIEAAAAMTRITHGGEPGNFVVCLKPFTREAGVDATIIPPEPPPPPSQREELEKLWNKRMGGKK